MLQINTYQCIAIIRKMTIKHRIATKQAAVLSAAVKEQQVMQVMTVKEAGKARHLKQSLDA